MCQYCSIDDDELTALPAEEVWFCDYCTEDEPPCEEDARYERKFRYMDEHLCEKHMQEQANELKEGLMDVQESLGLSTGVTIKKIEPEEKCEHAELLHLVECGRPASYALINTALSYVCEKHKKEK